MTINYMPIYQSLINSLLFSNLLPSLSTTSFSSVPYHHPLQGVRWVQPGLEAPQVPEYHLYQLGLEVLSRPNMREKEVVMNILIIRQFNGTNRDHK